MIYPWKHILLVSLLFPVIVCYSQSKQGGAKNKVSQKVLRYERKADVYFYKGDFQGALAWYQQACAADTSNAQVAFNMASCMYHLKKYKQGSLPYFERALR